MQKDLSRKFLSIVIPTYNRADALNRLLAWLAAEIKGFESVCEIIVADNCSSDRTREVIEQWRPAFSETTFRPIYRSENIGGLPNLADCLQQATGTFTWTVGDDDPIKDGTLAYIFNNLSDKPDLTLMYLNFSGRYHQTGEIIGTHWFDRNLERYPANGKAIFASQAMKNLGSVIFITATIYRTELVQAALQSWQNSTDNWAAMAYWAGYCAVRGSVLITESNFVECTIGVSHWEQEPGSQLKVFYRDIPLIYLKLWQLGLGKVFALRCIRGHFRYNPIFKPKLSGFVKSGIRFPLANLKLASFVIGAIALLLGQLSLKLGKSLLEQAIQLPGNLWHRVRLALHAPKLPNLEDPVDQAIVDGCRQDGSYVTSLAKMGLSAASAPMIASAWQYLELMAEEAARSPDLTLGSATNPAYPQIYTMTDFPEFSDWAQQPRLMNIIENYIGLPVKFQGVHLRRDFPNEQAVTTELWHRDLEDRRIIKVFLYLSDATEEYGAYEYVPRSQISWKQSLKIFWKTLKSTNMGITSETMSRIVAPQNWRTCAGQAGLLLFSDPKAVYHHGRSRSKTRSALFFVYTADQPQRPKCCTQYNDDTFPKPERLDSFPKQVIPVLIPESETAKVMG
jgi:abequosyltransferase